MLARVQATTEIRQVGAGETETGRPAKGSPGEEEKLTNGFSSDMEAADKG